MIPSYDHFKRHQPGPQLRGRRLIQQHYRAIGTQRSGGAGGAKRHWQNHAAPDPGRAAAAAPGERTAARRL